MIRSIFLAIALLLCGVATADPSSPNHDLSDHPELEAPLFCAASYVLFWNMVALDPTVDSRYKLEIRSRSEGLIDQIDEYLTSINHNDRGAIAYLEELLILVKDLIDNRTALWAEMLGDSYCKDMTNQYAFVLPNGETIL